MHIHICRHCKKQFLCDEPLDCFRLSVTCRDCFRQYDIPIFLFVIFLGVLTIGLVLVFNRVTDY